MSNGPFSGLRSWGRGFLLSQDSTHLSLDSPSSTHRNHLVFSSSFRARSSAFLLLNALSEGDASQALGLAARHLSDLLAADDRSGLQQALRRLSSGDRSALHRRFGNLIEEIASIGEEEDPELFYSALLSIGQRALRDGDATLSMAIFQGLAEGPEEFRSQIPSSVRARALQEYDASRGRGAVGGRFEYLARHFSREASDPGMLLGMGIAGTVFSSVRLGVLSRLASRPALWWTRGIGAGVVASASAFPAEILAFWGSNRLYNQLARPETLRWDLASIGQEFASLGITLGFLKLFGAASGHLFDRVHGIHPATGAAARLPAITRFSRVLFQQLGTFGGIATGHYAEMRLGLRPRVNGDTFWTDCWVTLLQFHVGGRLSHELMGPRHAARMQEMAFRTQVLESPASLRSNIFPPLGGEFAFANEGIYRPLPAREGASREHILEMSMGNSKDKALRPGRGQGSVVLGGREGGSANLEAPFQAMINALYHGEASGHERFQISRELAQNLPLARRVFAKMLQSGELSAEEGQLLSPAHLEATIQEIHQRHFRPMIHASLNPELSISERYQISQDLLPDQDLALARDVFSRMRRAGEIAADPKSKEVPADLDAALHRLNLCHFEGVSDQMHEWHARFNFLQGELREEVHRGTRNRRRQTRRLLESVQLKLLETRRYHHNAESYLGDVKGPSPKSVFAPGRYGRLLHRFRDISERLERYIEGKPELKRLLAAYQSPVSARGAVPRMEPEAIEAELGRSSLSAEHQDLFRQALAENDVMLTQYESLPVGRWLRELNTEGNPRRARQSWRSLGEYLEVSSELRNLLGSEAFHEWQVAYEKLMLSEGGEESAGPILQQILSSKTTRDTSGLVTRFLSSLSPVANSLARHQPLMRLSSALHWPEMRAQMIRLAERNYLTPKTVEGLLEWFDPPKTVQDRPAIHAIREEASAGLIDFVRKGSHTPEVRRELSAFFEEVVRRRDLRMMSFLAISFQNYQLGMMRDRIQVRAQPSKDLLRDRMAIESHDRFLEGMRATARFYLDNPRVLGPYFEVFEKLEYGRNDDNALLASPILQRTQGLLDEGYSVELLNRGGLGQALLQAKSESGEELIISLSSVLDHLQNRSHLENWLDRAEREFLHAGEYLNGNGSGHQLILDLQIPRIRSGVSKRELSIWARDYLEAHPLISEVRLAIPERGSEAADPFDPADFRVERITRSMATTEALIQNRELDVERNPQDVAARMDLFRLRQDWAQAIEDRDRELKNHISNPGWQEFIEDRVREAEGALARLRSRELAFMDPANPIEDEASPGAVRPARVGALLPQIESASARLAKYRRLAELSAQTRALRESNWTLLLETARLFPEDPGVISQVERSITELFQHLEKVGGNTLTEDRQPRRGGSGEYGLDRRRNIFFQVAQMFLGTSFDTRRIPALFDLRSVGHSIRNLQWSFDGRGLGLRGDIVPDSALTEYEHHSRNPEPGRRSEVPGEPDAGSFLIRFGRERRGRAMTAYFDHLTLPPHLRGQGVGTAFFVDFLRMLRAMKIPQLQTPDVSGDHRYSLSVFGVAFRRSEDREKVIARFRTFMLDYMMNLPEFEDYDLSALAQIQRPRDLARAHLDPVLRRLSIEEWEGFPGEELPDYHRVGRLFLMNEAPSFNGVFELKDQSYSMRAFDAYLAGRRGGRGFFNPSEEN